MFAVFPVAVPVGSQWQHGTGVGLSLKLRGEEAVAVTFGGDGSTSEGDFHEAVNCAGVFDAKTVFVIQNNQWAISVPLHQQTAAETLAQKAHAYGVPGIQVDGNDVFAVYVGGARGPRAGAQRRRPDPDRGRDLPARRPHHRRRREPVPRATTRSRCGRARDPILRLRRYLESAGLVGRRPGNGAASKRRTAWVDAQVAALEDMTPQDPEAIFTHMYAEMPPHLAEQMAELARGGGVMSSRKGGSDSCARCPRWRPKS